MSDFNAKMHQIRFPQGNSPSPRWGSLQRSLRPVAVFKGPTSKWREGRREGNGERNGSEEDGEETEGGGQAPQIFWPITARGGESELGRIVGELRFVRGVNGA